MSIKNVNLNYMRKQSKANIYDIMTTLIEFCDKALKDNNAYTEKLSVEISKFSELKEVVSGFQKQYKQANILGKRSLAKKVAKLFAVGGSADVVTSTIVMQRVMKLPLLARELNGPVSTLKKIAEELGEPENCLYGMEKDIKEDQKYKKYESNLKKAKDKISYVKNEIFRLVALSSDKRYLYDDFEEYLCEFIKEAPQIANNFYKNCSVALQEIGVDLSFIMGGDNLKKRKSMDLDKSIKASAALDKKSMILVDKIKKGLIDNFKKDEKVKNFINDRFEKIKGQYNKDIKFSEDDLLPVQKSIRTLEAGYQSLNLTRVCIVQLSKSENGLGKEAAAFSQKAFKKYNTLLVPQQKAIKEILADLGRRRND